jgi:hypothetical protein
MKIWEEKLDHFISILPKLTGDAQHYRAVGVSILARIKAIMGYEWNPTKMIKSHTTLLKSNIAVLKAEEDYGLSKVSMSDVLL